MALDNRKIWMAGAFNSKRGRLNIISGRSEYRWKNIVTRVESILAHSTQMFVVVAAGGDYPVRPSDCDIANARLAATVVAMQWKYSIRCKKIRALLKYPANVQVEVEVDVAATKKQIKTYLASTRKVDSNTTLPTPVLSYLLIRSL